MEIPLKLKNRGIVHTDQGTAFEAYDLYEFAGQYVQITGSAAFRVVPRPNAAGFTEGTGGTGIASEINVAHLSVNDKLLCLVDVAEPVIHIAADAAATTIRINPTSDKI